MLLPQKQPLDQLRNVISDITEHIHDYTKSDSDFTRNRKLNAETLIKVTLNMQGNSLNAELMDAFPDINDRVTASAYEQAKAKLTPAMFEDMFKEYNNSLQTPKVLTAGKNYRVFAIDGCDFNIPYNSTSKYVVDPSIWKNANIDDPKKPFSMVHANMMYDIMTRTYHDCVLQPRTQSNERDAAIDMIKRTDNNKPFIVIMDRGYSAFNMIENCNRIENCYYVIRTNVSSIKEIKDLPDCDIDMDMIFRVTTSGQYYLDNRKNDPYLHLVLSHKKSYKQTLSKNTRYSRWDFEWYCEVKCRVVKFKINNSDTGKEEWEVLLTNLDRAEFPLSRMKEIYHMRWDIETSFRELKYALGAMNFHSKKDDFIEMELYAHFIMFNAVSRHINATKAPQANHKYPYAVDFKMACMIIRKYFRLYNLLPLTDIAAEIVSYINPVRIGRADKRKSVKSKSAIWFVYRVA